jgi:LacI family transcriptional regulator
MQRSKNGVTIVDIAKKLGVSPMTVSRALRGSSEVSQKTTKRVLRCAQELGYKPNRWARSLVTRKTSMIGVVIPDISHSFFAEVTRGVEQVTSPAGYNLLLCDSCLDPEKEKDEIDMLVTSRVEGLIVASEQPEDSPGTFQRLREGGVPFVLVDRYFRRCNFPAVVVDDVEVGRLATQHLIALGHRRIAHIRGPEFSPAALRYRGYQEALRACRIPINKKWVISGRFDIESGSEAARLLLKLDTPPTAIFAGNDPMAIGALRACREEGVDVPGDVSIVGAGNIEGSHHPNPFLTTMDWPRKELGRTAAALLLKIASERSPRENYVIEKFFPQLLIRQSTAPPHNSPER